MKGRLIYLVCCFCILVFSTCKKYPQGGWSNKAKKHLHGNLFNGYQKTWSLLHYEVNGLDSAEILKSGISGYNQNSKTINFSKDAFDTELLNLKTPFFSYRISFSKNYATMTFSPDANSSKSQCKTSQGCEREIFRPNGLSEEWRVIKLTESAIILTLDKQKLYKIELSSSQ